MELPWHSQVCACSIIDQAKHKQMNNDDFSAILEHGINFGKGGQASKADDGKVKTKAKKKKYITGAHGSGSARQKAKYREQRANRHKGK